MSALTLGDPPLYFICLYFRIFFVKLCILTYFIFVFLYFWSSAWVVHNCILYVCIFVFLSYLFFCISGRVLMVPGLGGPPSLGLAPAETDFGRFGADFEGSPGQVPLFR